MSINYRILRRAALAGVLTLPILTSGCGWLSQETTSHDIDPPQNTSNNSQTTMGTSTSKPSQGDLTEVTVYLKDGNGYLSPVTLQTSLEANQSAATKALELMVDGGAYASELPEGFSAILPQGTEIKHLNVDSSQQLAVVDFSEAFTDYNPSDERKIVEAVTWTLTGLQGIEQVELWSEGEKLGEMPVDGLPLDKPLTRAVGINLEKAEGTEAARSTPVTLYFASQTPEGDSYYVPVTRLVPRSSEDTLKAALDQLISGPLDSSNLTGVVLPDIDVDSVTKQDDTVTVNLTDKQFKAGEVVPAEMMEAVVLSLTETSGASKVQISLNGSTDYKDDNNASYTAPVSRPEHLNAFKS